jgi:DNA (cytosine-5)-methyltransferase 1
LNMSGRGKSRTGAIARGSAISSYPVVDLFAGPGGLGEGFASCLNPKGQRRFVGVASIERDEHSHRTLLLRHFLRQFPEGELPDDYYAYLAGRITLDELFATYPGAHWHAQRSALRLSLGEGSHAQVQSLIRERLAGAEKWALVGGPPCQAYSLAGRSRMRGRADFDRDERHTLYLEYLRIIADHRPPVFVMENVKGLLSASVEGKSTIARIVRDLSKPGNAIPGAPEDLTYKLYSLAEREQVDGQVDPRLFLVRAEEHGVPQARHRMFIVGVRGDLGVRPGTLRKQAPPTVRQTIGHLPAIRSSLSRQADGLQAWLSEIRQLRSSDIGEQLNGAPYAFDVARALELDRISVANVPQSTSSSHYAAEEGANELVRSLLDPRLSGLTSHEARGHMAPDLRRYFYAAVFAEQTGRSPKLADFPASLLPDHNNVELGRTGKMFSDRFRVQLPDQVSTTVTSHISKDGHYFIHYDPLQCRSLTVREAARLQTFPDNYFFAGPRTSQYHQVGNAVPPHLAREIACVVGEVLDSLPSDP